jgi:hypothetical protein
MLERRQLLQQMCWESGIVTCTRLKLDPYLSPCAKVNSRWIKDLKGRPEIWKLLQENIGSP